MFGFLKKKEPRTRTAAAIEASVALLKLQLILWRGEMPSGAYEDHFSLGYVFGWVEGTFQVFGVGRDAEIFLIALALKQIFTDELRGASVLQQCLDLQQEPEFGTGRLQGGEEAFAFYKTEVPPGGLGRHLKERFAP